MKTVDYFLVNAGACNRARYARIVLFFILMMNLAMYITAQERDYKVFWSHNYVKNPDFVKDADNSASVTDWTFNPSGDSHLGWKKDVVAIYGEYLFVDRDNTHTATPTLTEEKQPCENVGKFVRFKYNAGNTGSFTLKVILGGETIGTFSRWGIGAASVFTPGGSVAKYTINRLFFPTGMTQGSDQQPIWNNVWHVVSIYLPDYASGDLSFVYDRKPGDSRQVRLDDIALYEMIPTPKPKQLVVRTADCDANTYDLTMLTPDDNKYSYVWYSDARHTKRVENPQAAEVGSYYLFAEGCESYSYPSSMVKVTKPADCCGADIIMNGGFQDGFAHWAPSDPDNDYAIVDKDNYRTAINAWPTKDAEMLTPPTGDEKWMKLHSGGFGKRYLVQKTLRACAYDPKRLEFDLVLEKNGNVEYPFAVYLGTMIDRDIENKITKVEDGVKIFELVAEVGPEQRWRLQNIAEGVTVHIRRVEDGKEFVNPLSYEDGLLQLKKISAFNKKTYRHHLTVDVTGETVKKVKGGDYRYLAFEFDRLVRYHLDNISLSNLAPVAEEPQSPNGNMPCPGTTFDLTSVEPDVTKPERAHKFQWYADESGTTLVNDPTAVPEGTYYMKTISTCSGCESETLTPFVVQKTCPTVSGTLYSNFDGGNFDGNKGTNGGGMYAHLVARDGESPEQTVIASTKIADDGSYTLTGVSGGQYRVIISAKQTPIHELLSESTLNPNYTHADYEPIAMKGVSKTFDLNEGDKISAIDFGVQSPPIASDITETENNKGAGTAHEIKQLYSVDDDPDWNNGTGQIVIFTAADTQENGKLLYDGKPIVVNQEYPAYNPAKLTFQTETDQEAKVIFKYKYKDNAGQLSPEEGVVNYTFIQKEIDSIDETTWTTVRIYVDDSGNVVVDNADEEALNIHIVDALGRSVARRHVDVHATVRIPTPARGLYIVKASTPKNTLTRRVMVP